MTQEYIEEMIASLEATRKEKQKKITQFGWCRLLLIIAALLSAVVWNSERAQIWLILAFFSLALFTVFVVLQNKEKRQEKQAGCYQKLWEKIKQHQNGHYEAQELLLPLPDEPYYLKDLDVFQTNSLYEALCFVEMPAAKKKLQYRLANPLSSQEEILRMQKALQSLHENPLAKDYLVTTMTLDQHERSELKAEDFTSLAEMPSYLKWLVLLYPCAQLFLLILHQYSFCLYMLFVPFILYYAHYPFFSKGYALAEKRIEASAGLDKLAAKVKKADFQDPYLKEKQDRILDFSQKKKSLDRIVQFLKVRYNPLLWAVLNALCFYDGFLYMALQKHKDARDLLALQDELADLGALCSMAMWYDVKQQTVLPTFSTKLKAQSLKYPLMAEKQAVGADLTFYPGAVVITGSNMAGKTTFMRNIGLNLVLFYSGLSVCAAMFEAPLLDIYTSMRIADRSQEGISTFYAELQRIKAMVKQSQSGRPTIYFIDEIFKGTNLKDRIVGAKATIAKLVSGQSFLFVTTHDEALCYHDRVPINNIHFEEHYEGNQILFDYLPKNGIAKTTNARFLMKMIGLLE